MYDFIVHSVRVGRPRFHSQNFDWGPQKSRDSKLSTIATEARCRLTPDWKYHKYCHDDNAAFRPTMSPCNSGVASRKLPWLYDLYESCLRLGSQITVVESRIRQSCRHRPTVLAGQNVRCRSEGVSSGLTQWLNSTITLIWRQWPQMTVWQKIAEASCGFFIFCSDCRSGYSIIGAIYITLFSETEVRSRLWSATDDTFLLLQNYKTFFICAPQNS